VELRTTVICCAVATAQFGSADIDEREVGGDQWIILDGGRQISTGAPAQDRRKAEKALEK
jgi:hypothetical protein